MKEQQCDLVTAFHSTASKKREIYSAMKKKRNAIQWSN